ncbi:MAG: SIS domain-containing protein [Anaerolineales bacterium]|nr:SIS domain-containing protein [Anaerolineales bacterium]
MHYHDEINEQPQVFRTLLDAETANVHAIAAALRTRVIRYMVIAGRGTSDNAGQYGKYLFGSHLRLPTVMATPSLYTLYDQGPKMEDGLVIGLSQSGEPEDVVSVLEAARAEGAATLAITNHNDSPLAQTAEHVIDIHAGKELAVTASKTYSNTLGAIAMFVAAWLNSSEMLETLTHIPAQMKQVLELEDTVRKLAAKLAPAQQLISLGRTYTYGTALEAAIKLKESCYLAAQAYSPADFMHGPIAVVEPEYPVLIFAANGPGIPNMLEFTRELKELEPHISMVSNAEAALSLADVPIPVPAMAEWAAPMTMILPAQLLSLHIALERGLNPDHPRGLKKVTMTR